MLQNLIPQIVEAYIEGRLTQVCDEGAVNPLDDPEGLQEELTQFPQMIRFVYDKSGQWLLEKMEATMRDYEVAARF